MSGHHHEEHNERLAEAINAELAALREVRALSEENRVFREHIARLEEGLASLRDEKMAYFAQAHGSAAVDNTECERASERHTG